MPDSKPSIPIRNERAEADHDRLDEHVASLIKGMLARGDKQSDIAACFLLNSGRVAEINLGQRFPLITQASATNLPPPGPYPSPFELWKHKYDLWRVYGALKEAGQAIERALASIQKAERS